MSGSFCASMSEIGGDVAESAVRSVKGCENTG